MFRVSRLLLAPAAKANATKGKAPAGKAAPGKGKVEEKKSTEPKKHLFNLVQLLEFLPKPEGFNPKDPSTWLNKNGYGLKFYRKVWKKHDPPAAPGEVRPKFWCSSYWTVVRFRRPAKGVTPKAWGFFTWKGQTSSRIRSIPGIFRTDCWRFIPENGTMAEAYTPSKMREAFLAELKAQKEATKPAQ